MENRIENAQGSIVKSALSLYGERKLFEIVVELP